MITEKKKVLKIISERLKGKKINWCLIGSTNLRLQGINIKANDIDILTDEKGAHQIGKILKEYEIEPVQWRESKKLASYYGKFKINNVEVEILGETRIKNVYYPLEQRKKIIIKIDDFEIPCANLKQEYQAYKNMERKEKAELIKQKLKTTSF